MGPQRNEGELSSMDGGESWIVLSLFFDISLGNLARVHIERVERTSTSVILERERLLVEAR